MTPRFAPSLIDRARDVLATVAMPDGGDLAGSGRIEGLSATNGKISLAIRIRPDEAAAFAPVRAAAEVTLRELAGVTQAMVVLTAESAAPPPPKTPPTLDAPSPAPRPLADVRHVIAVASGKGGVGKSTTAVNLALAVRALGYTVGVLDADIYGPSLPTLLGLTGKPQTTQGRKLRPMDAYGLKAMSIGLLVDPETAMIWRGPMVMSAITQMIADVDWGALDMLIVDMPPGTGDAQLALAQGTQLAGAVIVSTPQDLSLIDARRGIAMFRKVDVPILGLVENMAHFVCPDCGGEHAIFGQGGARDEAARLGVPFLGAVPLTMELREASDRGRPVVASQPDGPIGGAFGAIARGMIDSLNDQKR
ncbi:MAG: ATP-binding protein involved in chromosome partitioning [Rhodobacteraceae bacterium HLUCCA12]|nr:MAG: ATP-binding protein involved in chromosome partitioning [Rhodobacteraceae bacterium HLUCCA12]